MGGQPFFDFFSVQAAVVVRITFCMSPATRQKKLPGIPVFGFFKLVQLGHLHATYLLISSLVIRTNKWPNCTIYSLVLSNLSGTKCSCLTYKYRLGLSHDTNITQSNRYKVTSSRLNCESHTYNKNQSMLVQHVPVRTFNCD
jgi:hypothetical protein